MAELLKWQNEMPWAITVYADDEAPRFLCLDGRCFRIGEQLPPSEARLEHGSIYRFETKPEDSLEVDPQGLGLPADLCRVVRRTVTIYEIAPVHRRRRHPRHKGAPIAAAKRTQATPRPAGR